MDRQSCFIGIALNKIAYAVVHTVGIVVIQVVRLKMEALMQLCMSRMQQQLCGNAPGFGYKAVKTLAGSCTYWNDGNAKLLRQRLAVDTVAVFLHLVHHIECDDHRPLKLQQLDRQIQISFKVCGVNDVDYCVRLFGEDVLPCHTLLHAEGRQRIYARKVDEYHLVPVGIEAILAGIQGFDPALLLFDRHACPVSDILPFPCHGIEQRRLAAVWVAHQRKPYRTLGSVYLVGNGLGLCFEHGLGAILMAVCAAAG